MDVGFKTDKGIRRYNNEDACFVMMKEKVFIVADGVGGANSGEIASRTATRYIADYVSKRPIEKNRGSEYIRKYFHNCLRDANFEIFKRGQKFPENYGMATTIVVAYIENNHLYLFNVGDSRGYVFRNGRLLQITEDHTYVNNLVKAGLFKKIDELDEDEKHMITRALGAELTIEEDCFELDLEENDILLMCTDGLYGEISEREMEEYFNRDYTMSDTCSSLVELANLNGGWDNITLICLKYTKEDSHE